MSETLDDKVKQEGTAFYQMPLITLTSNSGLNKNIKEEIQIYKTKITVLPLIGQEEEDTSFTVW